MNGTVKRSSGPNSSMTPDLHLHHFNFNDRTANLFGLKMTVGKMSTAEHNKPNFFNEKLVGGSQTIRALKGEETLASNWLRFDLHCFKWISQTFKNIQYQTFVWIPYSFPKVWLQKTDISQKRQL